MSNNSSAVLENPNQCCDNTLECPVAQVRKCMQAGEAVTLLDLRDKSEFESWKFEVPASVPVLNIPYFELLEETGKDDVADAAEAYASGPLAEKVPAGSRVAVMCAKGGTSLQVVEGLQRAGYKAVSIRGGMQAWGNFYEFTPVVEADRLGIYQVSRPARGCLSYIVASQGEAIVVDPLRHSTEYTNFITEHNLTVKAIIDTHGHADHISSGPELAEGYNLNYWLHAYDAIHPIDVLPTNVNYEPLRDRQVFTVGAITIQVLHVPGHTLGNVVLLVDDKYLLSGDTLFVDSVARPDLGGKAETWAPLHYQSLNRLLSLPDDTVVLPGHFSSARECDSNGVVCSTIKKVKVYNDGVAPLLRGREAFMNHILSAIPSFPPQYVDIKRVNAGLLTADEDKASELELGRNECALSGSANH